jgi:hypothetical protein
MALQDILVAQSNRSDPTEASLQLRLITFIVFLGCSFCAWGSDLPESCGKDQISFDVKTAKPDSALPAPADGKARIVLLQTTIKSGFITFMGRNSFTARFAIDGQWVGATSNNSYFSLDLAPGEHHVCASIQRTTGASKREIGVSSFTAVAGKTYFFQYMVQKQAGNQSNSYSFGLSLVDPDEGKFRIKDFEIASSTTSASSDSH